MSIEIVKNVPFNQPTLEDALCVVESLRKDIESGKVVAFAVVAIEQDDTALVYTGSTRPVTRLRMMGAISHMQHLYMHGGEGD